MKRLLSALAAASMIAIVATSVAIAGHAISGDSVAPQSNNHTGGGVFGNIPGNVTCGGGYALELKIEGDDLGVGNYGPIDITAYNGKYISWAINTAYLNVYDANLVLVKGGPNTMGYYYDTNDDWDTNLTAPRNPNGAQPKYYGISHVSFCFDPKA